MYLIPSMQIAVKMDSGLFKQYTHYKRKKKTFTSAVKYRIVRATLQKQRFFSM